MATFRTAWLLTGLLAVFAADVVEPVAMFSSKRSSDVTSTVSATKSMSATGSKSISATGSKSTSMTATKSISAGATKSISAEATATRSMSAGATATRSMSTGASATRSMSTGASATRSMSTGASATRSMSTGTTATRSMSTGATATRSMSVGSTATRSLTAGSTATRSMSAGTKSGGSGGQQKKTTSTTTRTMTTTTTVTVYKTSAAFKKKCWSDSVEDADVTVNAAETCRAYGYNARGLYVVPELVNVIKSLNRQQRAMAARIVYPRDSGLSVKTGDEFDVIVVGCGAAGSVLAAKLSDEKALSVLVLEAGVAPSVQSEIPALWANSVGTRMDWNYRVLPDPTFGQSLVGKRARAIRGKCMGGTTGLNTMLYDRGLESDYKRLGLPGWSYREVVDYYVRSEDCRFEPMATHRTVGALHGRGGRLCVDSFRDGAKTAEMRRAYGRALRAFAAYGTAEFFDEDGESDGGNGGGGDAGRLKAFVSSVATVKNGLRVNAAKAFLRNADRKYNLKVAAGSVAQRVLFDDDRRAVAVEFVNSVGQLIRVNSRRRVVVSAGPVGTPALLVRSGVGPADEVRAALGREPVVDNDRVGANLQAHPLFLGLVVTFDVEPVRPYSVSEMVYEYLAKQTGPLAAVGMCSFTGFVDTNDDGVPDVQIHNYYYAPDDTVFMPRQLEAFNLDDAVAGQLIDLNDDRAVLLVGISLLRPSNTGRVTVRLPDDCGGAGDCVPVPAVEYGSLDDADVQTLVQAVKWARDLMRSDEFGRYGPKVVSLKLPPGGPEPDADSDDYWTYAVKHLTTMNVQMAGTCAMATDPADGVVDERLSVFGAERLMVVDSSALPVLFGTESSAPTMMVAEKAADIVLEELGYKQPSAKPPTDDGGDATGDDDDEYSDK